MVGTVDVEPLREPRYLDTARSGGNYRSLGGGEGMTSPRGVCGLVVMRKEEAQPCFDDLIPLE